MCPPSGKAASNAAADARYAEEQRQAATTQAIGRVNETFDRFDEPFFDSRAQAFGEYAMPQIDDQYGRARKDLIFALSRSGLGNSSVAATRLADLERDYGTRKMEVQDQARGYAQEARANVEQSRSSLIGQAQATADASLAGQSAMNEANRLAAMPSFSPLGALFQNVGAGIGTARAAQDASDIRNAASGARLYQQTGSGSARVVH